MPDAVRRYARSTETMESETDGAPVVLHLRSWDFFEFDRVGGVIWQLLEEPMSADELVDLLVGRFEVGRDQCEDEVGQFLEKAVAAELVTVSD